MVIKQCILLLELQAQNKKIILCKVPTNIEIIENEEVDKALDMPGMTTTGELETPNGKGNDKNSIRKVPTRVVGNMKLSWIGSVLETRKSKIAFRIERQQNKI